MKSQEKRGEMMRYTVSDSFSGRPLRDFLRREAGVSARLLARLKRDEAGLLVNGERVTVRRVLAAGDVIDLADFPAEDGGRIEPVGLPVRIVYEDEHIIVADKPPFMPTHPSHDHHYDTLANALAYLHRDEPTPFVFRPVSRLDRNTSGLVTVAKTKFASSKLNALMQSGGFHKTYTAILHGVPSPKDGVIRTGLRRTAESIIVREVCPLGAPGSDEAITRYSLVAESNDGSLSLVRVEPLTGRTHQIRVHMASLGTPLCGEDLYREPDGLIDRHALHASSVEFLHPISGEPICLTSPLPDDMQALLDSYFSDYLHNNERNTQ